MTSEQVAQHQLKHGFGNPLAPKTEPAPLMPLIVTSDDRIDFFMEFEPPTVTAQHKGARIVIPRVGKPFIHFFTKKEIEAAAKLLNTHLAPFIPAQPFTGPLRLVTEWTFPWRTSEPKKERIMGWKWKDTHGDADNLFKLLSDQMAECRFFHNDSQIADLRVSKTWGDRPGIRITLQQLQNP